MKRILLLLLSLAAWTWTGPILGAPRPNILFIMADDHAAHAISAYGSRINHTPQLDRIARDGVRFGNCFAVNSICTPSRASILTGQYSHRNGVPVFNRFDGSQPHVAKEELHDDDQFADHQPPHGVDGPFPQLNTRRP
jgi:hypothetical protein